MTQLRMEKVDLICEEQQMLEPMPGFRFHPTEEELVGFYLRQKNGKKPFKFNLIKDIDLYAFEPWDLPGLAINGGEREWFFFVKPRGHTDGRPNRITAGGFWKATGTDRPVFCHSTSALIGMRKTLVFYKGRAPKGHKTDWIMNEYRLHSGGSENGGCVRLCRVYRKAITMRSLDHRHKIQVEKGVNNEIAMSSSSLVPKYRSQGNSAHSYTDCSNLSMEVKIEDLTHVSSLEKWWCWDGGSSNALAFLWD